MIQPGPFWGRCPVDDTLFQACGAGQDHMSIPPIDWPPPEGTAMTDTETQENPEELGEYHYYIGYIEFTAQMTPSMAEAYGAVPIGQPLPPPTLDTNRDLRGSVLNSESAKMRPAAKNKRS